MKGIEQTSENYAKVIDFLGEDNKKKIQDYMVSQILKEIHESISEYYLIPPHVFEEMYNDLCEEVMKKYRPKIKKAMCEEIEKLIEKGKRGITDEKGNSTDIND